MQSCPFERDNSAAATHPCPRFGCPKAGVKQAERTPKAVFPQHPVAPKAGARLA